MTMAITPAGYVPTQQLASLSTIDVSALGNTNFPPVGNTEAGATQPPFARFGAGFLNAILPTNGVAQIQSPFASETIAQPGSPTSPGSNAFSATYAPEIYAVVVNGLVAQASVNSGASDPPHRLIAAIAPLAGSGQIFSSGPGQTVTASTDAARSSASRSTQPATTK